MKQVIHIFKKDVRRHWLEILLSLAILAAFVWNEPSQWAPRELSADRPRDILTGALNIGVILGWCVLVIRVVQGESLVGDRQFWITKPYDWKKLLAAKLFFMLVFISMPSLIAGSILYTRAGFGSPLPVMLAIISMQAVSISFVVVTVMALATVTATIAQFLVGALTIGAYVAITATIAAYVPSQSFYSGSDPLQEGIMAVGCVVAVVWQYSRRRTPLSRAVLAIAAVAIFVIVLATPYQSLVAREYVLPPAGSQSVNLSFDDVKRPAPEVTASQEKEVEVQIPVKVEGIVPATSLSVDGATLTLQGPDGQEWSSGWNNVGLHLFPDDRGFSASFKVKKAFFERVKSVSVHAHVSFALSTFQNGETKRIVASAGEFKVPGLGFCSIGRGYATISLRCRYAFGTPTLLTTIASSEMPCSFAPNEAPPSGLIARDWSGTSEADLVSPVGTTSIYFWGWAGNVASKSSPTICPGTPLIFRRQEVGQRIRIEIEINGIRLENYQVSNAMLLSVVR